MAGGTTAVTTTEPWEAQKGYLETGFGEAGKLYAQGRPDYYPGATVAGFDPSQTAAQQATLGYAMGPRAGAMQAGAENALLGQMAGTMPFNQGQMTSLLGGYVPQGEGTPYGGMAANYQQQFVDAINKGMADVRKGQVLYQPGGSSRGDIYQSNVFSGAAKTLGQNLNEMYMGAYDQAQGMRLPPAEMQLGQRTAGLGQYPTIMGAPLGMYQAMGDVGEQRRAMSQAGIDQAQAKYNYQAMAPQQALQNYMAMVSGDYGSTVRDTPSGLQTLGQLAGIGMNLFGG